MQYWFYFNGIVFLRVGFVIILNGIMAFLVRRFNSIPEIIKETGKKTLLLYVLHVIILYGCAWFPGFYRYYAKSFTPIETILVTVIMLGLMLAVVQFSEKINFFRKRKIAFNKL